MHVLKGLCPVHVVLIFCQKNNITCSTSIIVRTLCLSFNYQYLVSVTALCKKIAVKILYHYISSHKRQYLIKKALTICKS